MIYAKIYTGPGVMTVNTVGEERLPWLPVAQALKAVEWPGKGLVKQPV